MSTELHRPDSSPPPDRQPNRPDHTTVWTWPTVTLTCVLTLAALAFAGILARAGTDLRMAGGIALLLISGIVVCVLPSRRSRGSLTQRVVNALNAFNGGDGGQGGTQ